MVSTGRPLSTSRGPRARRWSTRTCVAPATTTDCGEDMKRGIVLVWLMAMLLAVMVAVWPAESRRGTDPVLLEAVVDGGTEEHRPRLATTVEALGGGISIL